uniref:Uncharacterized protein n=1 Tax=viral metagenome TaxID=1070528 RepID=A0A6H1ZC02_9ZZZZ
MSIEVTAKARIFNSGSISFEPDEDITEKLRPLRGKNIIITFKEIENE